MHPILFHIGRFPVHSFGVMVLAGFLLGLRYTMAVARANMKGKPEGAVGVITPEHVFDMALLGLFVCIVGARILFVLLDLDSFRGKWLDVFKIWTGGISIHGAIGSGIFYLLWYCKRHKLKFWEFADLCAPGYTLGYAIGRIGCFLNGCCYGYACSMPWATRFYRDDSSPIMTPPSHPTQLYATGMNLIIFGFLDWWRRRPHPRGAIFIGDLILYCVYRFIDEHFRNGATADVWFAGLTSAQIFSVAAIPVFAVILWKLYHPSAKRAEVHS